MHSTARRIVLTGAFVGGLSGIAEAQTLTPLTVGTAAPHFTMVSSTRSGVADSVRLSDFRGKTVVLAFFYRVRTKG